jgi:DNA-directed RNA polymerase specialized sigma24 family protein
MRVSKRLRVDERAQVHHQGQVDLEAVYREHGERLWRALMGFTGDRELTDETVSEVFAQAHSYRIRGGAARCGSGGRRLAGRVSSA